MIQLGTWGTEIEIFAMATILNTKIYIYSEHGATYKWLAYEPLTPILDTVHKNEMIMIKNVFKHFEPVC